MGLNENDGLVLRDAGIIRFLPGQFIQMAIENVLKKGQDQRGKTGRLSPDGGHHELLVANYVNDYNYKRLHSAIGYVNPSDKLAGKAPEIWARRERQLELAR